MNQQSKFYQGIILLKKFGYLTKDQLAILLNIPKESILPYIYYVVQGRYGVYDEDTEVIKLCPLVNYVTDYELLNCMDVVCALKQKNNIKEIHVLEFEDSPFKLFIVSNDGREDKFFNICYFPKGKEEDCNYKIQKLTREENFIIFLEEYNERFIKENENLDIKLFAFRNDKGEIQFEANQAK